MKLFLDTAETSHWKALADSGLFCGITTNPLLLQRAQLRCSIETYRSLYAQAMALGFSSIQFQVFGDHWDQCAAEIAAIGPEVYVKIPADLRGFKAAQILNLPSRTTLTAVYSVGQVVAAEALGVAYAAPYYARLMESGVDADERFNEMLTIATDCGLLVASLRSPAQCLALATRGFTTFALPPEIAASFFKSALTDQAIEAFEAAARA